MALPTRVLLTAVIVNGLALSLFYVWNSDRLGGLVKESPERPDEVLVPSDQVSVSSLEVNVEVPLGSLRGPHFEPRSVYEYVAANVEIEKGIRKVEVESLRASLDKLLLPNELKYLEFMHTINVWPLVYGRFLGSKGVEISPAFKIFVNEDNSDLIEIVDHMEHSILDKRLRRHHRGRCYRNKTQASNSTAIISFLAIEQSHEFDHTSQVPTLQNEKYCLYIGEKGMIIRVWSKFALIRALATFAQLLPPSSTDTESKVCEKLIIKGIASPFLIVDQPAFEYRGVLIDTSRNFYRVDSLLKVIRTLGMSKLNVMHWHFVDDQSYGFESRAVPDVTLSTHGLAYNHNMTYSFDDIRRVVEEGRRWGVRVIPEMDLPGHSAGFIALDLKDIERNGYFLTKCPRFSCTAAWSITVNPLSPRTWDVLDKLLNEMTTLFPDPEVHLGGDEVPAGCWGEDPQTSGRGKDSLLKTFEAELGKITQKLKRNTIRWQESRHSFMNEQNPSPVTFQYWSGDIDGGKRTMKDGYKTIFSVGLYLDNDCHNWRQCYGGNQFMQYAGTVAVSDKNLRGFETCAWELSEGELTTENLWMRFVGVADHMWSASDYPKGGSTRGYDIFKSNPPPDTRVLAHCRLLSEEMGLFPPSMCSDNENRVRPNHKNTNNFQNEVGRREARMCHLMGLVSGDKNLPCTSKTCQRQGYNGLDEVL